MSYFVTILCFVSAIVNLSAIRADEYSLSYRLSNAFIGLLYLLAAIWCIFNVWGM